jgi:hypothetical protein
MLSVDADPRHFGDDHSYVGRAKRILERHKVQATSVFLPGDWNDVVGVFNVSGYGKIVIDGKGIVRGVNVRGAELEKLVEQILDADKQDK